MTSTLTPRHRQIARIPLLILAAALLFASLPSCIHNDIPFPRIPQDILDIAAQYQSADAIISDKDLSVEITLHEYADIRKVRFDKFEITPGATSSVNLLEGYHDLSRPMRITLSRYQDYDWIITVRQPITRYFVVEGQVGESVIDPIGHRVLVTLPESANLADLTLTQIKLGPDKVSTMTPDLKPGTLDLSKPLHVTVSFFDQSEDWTIFAEKTELLVSTDAVDAWSQVIWAYGTGEASETGSFQYRTEGSDTWTDVPQEWVTQNGGSFSCRIIHLTPLTTYEVRAISGDNIGNEIKVTTGSTPTLPDADFDQWWLKGKCWNPWDENGTQFWDTGNPAASTLGQSNVQPTDHTVTGSGQAAMLETRFVGIGMLGKLAAGSIYTGTFKRIDGTNGVLDFGRPWTQRPTSLRGYFQYKTAPINYTSSEWKHLEGRPDSCHIYVALTDWTAPFEIRTNPKNQQLLDVNSPSIIAYGDIIFGGTMDEYQEFEIKLNYRSTSRIPTYLLITCASSKYGDYFTGGTGAVLYVDQFSLNYDY